MGEADITIRLSGPTRDQALASLSIRLHLSELSRRDALRRLAAAEAAHDALWDEHIALKQCAGKVADLSRTLVADIDAYDTLLTDPDDEEILVRQRLDSGTATAIDALLERDLRTCAQLSEELATLDAALAERPADAEGDEE